MLNEYRQFLDLIPEHPLEWGEVTAAGAGHITVTLPGGDIIHARGAATVGQRVWIRDGAVEGEAAALTYVEGEA